MPPGSTNTASTLANSTSVAFPELVAVMTSTLPSPLNDTSAFRLTPGLTNSPDTVTILSSK